MGNVACDVDLSRRVIPAESQGQGNGTRERCRGDVATPMLRKNRMSGVACEVDESMIVFPYPGAAPLQDVEQIETDDDRNGDADQPK